MLGVAYKTHLSHTYYIIITKDKSIINSCKNTTLPHFLHKTITLGFPKTV